MAPLTPLCLPRSLATLCSACSISHHSHLSFSFPPLRFVVVPFRRLFVAWNSCIASWALGPPSSDFLPLLSFLSSRSACASPRAPYHSLEFSPAFLPGSSLRPSLSDLHLRLEQPVRVFVSRRLRQVSLSIPPKRISGKRDDLASQGQLIVRNQFCHITGNTSHTLPPLSYSPKSEYPVRSTGKLTAACCTMAENMPPSSLPPPPSTANAPGYEGPPGANGHNLNPHMPPPPLPPVVIPQNTNPIPTAITSPMSGEAMSPGFGGQVRRAAPEPNKRALYVGGLDPRVTEDVLKQIFETTGHVQSVKIIPDKNVQSKGLNYGFVEYDDPGAAERAMTTLNGRRVHQSEIRVNWAYQSNTNSKEDTSNHFHIFVGDLSNEVNDEVLLQAFSAFGSVSEARVMWDMKTGRSRGYGFVAFRERPDAEKALSSMDGEWLGSRAIRCNWANQKGQPSISQQQAMAAMGMTPTTPFGHHHFPTHGVQSYDMVVQQTPNWQTTCYVGNLTPYTTQNDLVPLFQNFGYVVETRFQSDRGFAFVKMDTHENAAMAICQLSGYNVNGRPLKCSWGKDRPPTGQFDQYSPQTSLNSASTPGFGSATTPGFGSATPNFGAVTTPGSGYQASPYYPQYGGGPPAPFTPQGPSPGGRPGWDANQQQGGYAAQQAMPHHGYGQMPGSAGGYGRGQPTTPGGGMYQQPPLQSYAGNQYPGY